MQKSLDLKPSYRHWRVCNHLEHDCFSIVNYTQKSCNYKCFPSIPESSSVLPTSFWSFRLKHPFYAPWFSMPSSCPSLKPASQAQPSAAARLPPLLESVSTEGVYTGCGSKRIKKVFQVYLGTKVSDVFLWKMRSFFAKTQGCFRCLSAAQPLKHWASPPAVAVPGPSSPSSPSQRSAVKEKRYETNGEENPVK